MKQGKHTCETLKAIRRDIASANDIDYTPTPCDYEGDCTGTCPACESEMRWIERQLRVRQALGKAVTVAGVSLALSLGASAATPTPDDMPQKKNTNTRPTKNNNNVRKPTAGVVMRPHTEKDEEAQKRLEEERMRKARRPTTGAVEVRPTEKDKKARRKLEEERMRKIAEEERKKHEQENRDQLRGRVMMPPTGNEEDSLDNVLTRGSQFVAEGDTIITPDGKEVVVKDMVSGIVPAPPKLIKNYIYTDVDVEAKLPDGDEAMDSLIRDQLYIPDEILEPIREMGGTVKARCIVKALVEIDGSISDAVIEKSTTAQVFDDEAIKAVKNLPPFIPASIYNTPVRSWKLIPVEFIYDFSGNKPISE